MPPPTSKPTQATYKPEPVARNALNHFVYEFDPRVDSMPKRIDPALVERFLRSALQGGRPTSGAAAQMTALADFYLVAGIVPDWITLFDRQEKTDDQYLSSLILVGEVGVLGDEKQQVVALGYFHDLLARPAAANHLEEALMVYPSFASQGGIGAILQRIDDVIASLQARASSDYLAGVSLGEAEDLRNVSAPRIVAALGVIDQISSSKMSDMYLASLVDIYLGIDERYNEILDPWAIRQLQREARSGRDVIGAFRRSLARIKGKPPEDVRRARALHAIEFFGGSLTPGERVETRPDFKKYDLLSND